MNKGRMEAFSDGVLAVIITIMVLEMKPPHGAGPSALRSELPVFLSYIMSFVYVGIYWNNHHHLLHAAQHVTGGILWANLHLLFWLSLTPFATAWMGENHFAAWPVALYGVILLFCGVAYFILTQLLMTHHGKESTLAASIGEDQKGKLSVVVYLIAVPLSFVKPWIACACYALVAVMWLIPDPRIEKNFRKESMHSH
jgi:Predicted integral membrane protein